MSLLNMILVLSLISALSLVLGSNNELCIQPCALPMVRLGAKEYYFHLDSKLTWMEAYKWCQTNGIELISIETEDEDTLIKRAVAGSGEVFWTSGTDLEEEGRFIWRSTEQNITYFGWNLREPDNLANHEHCIFLGHWSGSVSVGWYDSPCMGRHNFICEKS